MDQHILWTDVLNPVEAQMPGSPVFGSDGNLPFIDLEVEEPADLSIWNQGGASSSRRSLVQDTQEEAKMEHAWASSLTINGSQGSRTEERQLETTNMLLGSSIGGGSLEPTNMLPLENVNLNLNTNNEGGQTSSNFPSFLRNSDSSAAHIGRRSQTIEGQSPVPPVSGSSGSVCIPSSAGSPSLLGSFPRGVGALLERGDGRAGKSVDTRRFARKRKSIDGVSEHCSSSRDANCLYLGDNSSVHSASAIQRANTTLSISSSSNYLPGISPPGFQLNQRNGAANIGASDCHTYNATGNGESSQRNCRIRINPPQHVSNPNQWPHGNSHRSADHWSAHQSSNLLVPFNQYLESRVAVPSGNPDSQPPMLPIPALVQHTAHFPVNAASSSRTSSSSRSLAIAGQRSAAREESSSRNLPRTNAPDQPVLAPPADLRHFMQHPSSWSLTPTSQVGMSSHVQSSGPACIPNSNSPSQYQRALPEAGRQSIIRSARSGSGQSINIPSQPSPSANTLQELRNSSAAVLRSLQQSHMRAANGALSDASIRSMATRSRALSEHIRNALARRGEHILEGVLLLEHPAFAWGAADLHDRHRDMRLDVDNMSYEELLALTERIGNVSTGLSEEKIMKCLKQRKYISLSEETPSEVEPCCICQEEYVEEEDVGRLDCGHDFHTACIKQWLTLKNLCPICKTKGLVT